MIATENKTFPVDCDAGCGKSFVIKDLLTAKLDGGVEKAFFNCPHCGQEYVAYYTDPETRAMQAEIRDIRARLDKQYKEKLAKRHDKLKKKIQWRMIELRKKVEAEAEVAKEQKEEGQVEGDAE